MSRPEVLARIRDLLLPRAGEGDWSYVRRRERLRRHTAVEPLKGGGEAFPAMLAAIARARRSVHLETYILRDDATGRAFADALVERARAGVAARLLFDSVGCLGLPSSFLDRLSRAGVECVEFHPVAPWRPRHGLNKRDHKKILVVDDAVGFVGGLNLGLEYEDAAKGGGGWLDWHARVEGPAVLELAESFDRTWRRAGGSPPPRPVAPGPHLGPCVQGAKVVVNEGLRERFGMHRSYLHAIRAAKAEVAIMNAYFIPQRSLRAALQKAVRRGVRVRVVIPGETDVQAVAHASRHLHDGLLARGVELGLWPGMMHAKFAVIDRVWSTIGSYNLDRRSIEHNLEAGLVVLDRALGARLHDHFEEDWARSSPVTRADLARRSRWEKGRDAFWHALRYWL
jgi:cardiolipin synthase